MVTVVADMVVIELLLLIAVIETFVTYGLTHV